MNWGLPKIRDCVHPPIISGYAELPVDYISQFSFYALNQIEQKLPKNLDNQILSRFLNDISDTSIWSAQLWSITSQSKKEGQNENKCIQISFFLLIGQNL